MSTLEFRWHGRGGQGIVTANEILAGAALSDGKYMKAFPEFGPERMGAPVRAFARISDDPIKVHSQVYFPDYVAVLDHTLIGNINVLEGLKKNGALLVNCSVSPEEMKKTLNTDLRVCTVDADKIAKETIGKPIANTALLGAMIKISGVVKIDSIIEEMKHKLGIKFPAPVVEKNVSSVKRAYEEVQI